MGICRQTNMNWVIGIFGLLYSPIGDKYFDEALSEKVVIVDNGVDTSRAGYIQNMRQMRNDYENIELISNEKQPGIETEIVEDKSLSGVIILFFLGRFCSMVLTHGYFSFKKGQALALFFTLKIQPKGKEPIEKVGCINLVYVPPLFPSQSLWRWFLHVSIAPDENVKMDPDANPFSFDNRRVFKLNVVLGIVRPLVDS